MCQCLAGVCLEQQAPATRTPLKLLLSLLTVLLLLSASFVPAADRPIKDEHKDLQKGLAKVAKDIESFLKSQQPSRENALIAVGGFTGPTTPQGVGGPLLTKTLKEELKKLKLNIVDDTKKRQRPDLEIRGFYNDIQDKKTD